jgi:tRNA ligase
MFALKPHSTKPLLSTLNTICTNSLRSFTATIPQSTFPLTFRRTAIMAATNVPYAPQDVQEVQTLLRNLEANTKKGISKKTFSCKKTGFNVDGSSENLVVHSWRFQDWDYKRNDLPTYARGLFTGKNEKDQPEISVRGYDKFFNTEEVNETKWRNIENNTKGPYELSLKENGCIIFLSGMYDGTLLVCSKHSTGARDETLSHAKAAEKWVDRQLASIGKTREDLARELRKRNATAIAELCDDEFEEHILAYGKDVAGLYLHGININIPEFMTYPGPQIQAFADEWGFRRTDFLVIEDLQAMTKFLEEVAETGHYSGRDVEGFVIRCKARTTSSGPYSDWFFKYKFEEPYLMYRQWRECTKALISGKPPRFRKHVKITEEYLLFARRKLAENSKMAKQYQQNHGIIQLRDDFLREKNLKGSDIIRQVYAATGGAAEDVSKNVILVPIATLGCGKTTIALALSHLFGWGHVQNDNIQGKGRPPRFTREVLDQLEELPVVFADRNNAQRHERKQLVDDVQRTLLHIRLVALNFVHTPETVAKIREVTQSRVLTRGDNHQTIQAAADPNKVIGIMEGFISRFEALNPYGSPDDGFDSVIDLDPALSSRENLETVITQLHNTYPKLFFEDMPSSEDLDEAINVSMSEYKPEIKHEVGPKGGFKPPNKKVQQVRSRKMRRGY